MLCYWHDHHKTPAMEVPTEPVRPTAAGYQEGTLSVLEALYAAGRCCGVLLAGVAFSTVGGLATFAGLATVASAAALGYYVTARSVRGQGEATGQREVRERSQVSKRSESGHRSVGGRGEATGQ